MRIPLDYYRILGLPIQATAEQLKQSHRDRTLQVPRREYSELAIDARRQLLDAAYSVLGDSIRRAEYDQEFLASPKGASAPDGAAESEVTSPTIEIENNQLVGALLILLELGEYELVLRLGRPYLKRDVHTPEGQALKEQPALPDIILTLAVACLELGREEWQQNHYEHAAESLETGRELLLKEDLFPVLRAEIQADLYKLRPYRSLELIARPLDQQRSRQEGINLLRGMLQDRGGIDGAEDDLSGLGVDDFLRFVQQLRGYLTAAEQQEVFEAEAQRPSAVGTYLAVYALLARGFAQHQPALIRRAKQMLLRLSGRQDVHLEQAVCAVLLGQTEEASRALELSQEYEPLAFIREHSQGSPDLLPGLCLYAENWLQQEVFPFFRDLDQEPATLKDYFADSTVQSYLENLPLENERNNRQTSWDSQEAVQGQGAGMGSQSGSTSTLLQERTPTPGSRNPFVVTGQAGVSDQEAGGYARPSVGAPDSSRSLGSRIGAVGAAGAAGVAGLVGSANIAEKISRLSPNGQLSRGTEASGSKASGSGSGSGGNALPIPPARTGDRSSRIGTVTNGARGRRNRRNSPKWGRVAIVVLAGFSLLLLALLLARSIMSLVGGGNGPGIQGEPLDDVSINEPVIEIAPAAPTVDSVSPDDATGIARATINRWLNAKQAAYAGDTGQLDSVLAGSLLDVTQERVASVEARGITIDYTYGDDPITIISVEPEDATDADSLSVQAQVSETAEFLQDGQVLSSSSYSDDTVTATYELVRQGDSWLINDISTEN